jgi:hypothetical protein
MKNKGAGAMFRPLFATLSSIGSVAGLFAGRQIGSCGLVLARAWVDRPDAKGFHPRGVGAGALGAGL